MVAHINRDTCFKNPIYPSGEGNFCRVLDLVRPNIQTFLPRQMQMVFSSGGYAAKEAEDSEALEQMKRLLEQGANNGRIPSPKTIAFIQKVNSKISEFGAVIQPLAQLADRYELLLNDMSLSLPLKVRDHLTKRLDKMKNTLAKLVGLCNQLFSLIEQALGNDELSDSAMPSGGGDAEGSEAIVASLSTSNQETPGVDRANEGPVNSSVEQGSPLDDLNEKALAIQAQIEQVKGPVTRITQKLTSDLQNILKCLRQLQTYQFAHADSKNEASKERIIALIPEMDVGSDDLFT